ncbi:substrate-binding domain-containing protein [Ruficoccus amylovorans]|uniref:Substrate-binding domain-containing protein n=1 Tax=Ruficoccus amylovorans TaxID=1804625 RepID=A0A842HIR1_9BACT|nr:substrate-binding domain-containing protein [Ruficoccus amylovorans]MBC2596249.1 substrate-binding domain-containing protein [Ruficoccus amylovorans]
MHPPRHSAPFRPRNLILWLALALLPLSLSAQPREVWERYKIAVITGQGESPAAKAIEAGARAQSPELEKEYNLALTVDNLSAVDNTPKGCRDALHRAFLDGYNAVLLNIATSSEVADEIDFLTRHGIPVVTVGSDIGTARLAAVMTDEEASGRLAAETFIENLRYVRDNLGLIAGSAEDPVSRQRLAGAQAVLQTVADLHVQGPFHTPETFSATYQKIEEVTAADYGRNLRGWLVLGNWPLLGGRPFPWKPGDKTVVAMDAEPHIIPFIASGQVQSVIAEDYFSMGKLGLSLLIDKINNQKEPEQAVYFVEPVVITRKNLKQFQSDWTQWMK